MPSYHFIAIGGAIMHQLAIQLKKDGCHVSGSDDAIYDPALTNLKKESILPKNFGWDANKISSEIDAVILGMHAKKDNPELLKAQKLNIPIYSFPEFIAQRSKNKKRIVVAGSHGKTTTTSMIMHALKENGFDFDYLVGAKISGFDSSVKITSEALIIIIEGDEYLSSAIDKRSKFLHYEPDIAVITGIAWDHINVFPTYESYLKTFKTFITSIGNGMLIHSKNDAELSKLINQSPLKNKIAYDKIEAIKNKLDLLEVSINQQSYALKTFGTHNLENMAAAKEVCNLLGISSNAFFNSMSSYQNPDKRLNLIHKTNKQLVFRDFAHAPSKVKATVKAVVNHFNNKKVIAIFELHTFSSLDKSFLKHYANSLSLADMSIVFIDQNNPKIQHKSISKQEIFEAFNDDKLLVIDHKEYLKELLRAKEDDSHVILLMSSGNFGGLNLLSCFEEQT